MDIRQADFNNSFFIVREIRLQDYNLLYKEMELYEKKQSLEKASKVQS